jgi:hypothetical protein
LEVSGNLDEPWRPGSVIVFALFAPPAPPYRGDTERARSVLSTFRRWGWTTAVVHAHGEGSDAAAYPDAAELCDDLTVHFRPYPRPAPYAPLASWCPPGYADVVTSTCERLQADVLYVQLSLLAPCLGASSPPHLVKVIDADNLFYERASMFRRAGLDYDWVGTSLEEETAAIGAADLVVSVQEREHETLRRLLPTHAHALVPPYRRVEPSPQWLTRNILTIGNYYDAQAIGLRRFAEDGMPEVRALFPDATLTVIGTIGGDTPARPGVELLGHVDDVDPYFHRASIVLNPVLAGGGIKRKTIDALCRGKCLVSTPAGMDGLLHNRDIAVVEQPERLAGAIVELFAEPDRVRAFGERAVRFAADYFAPERAEATLRHALEPLLPPRTGSSRQ